MPDHVIITMPVVVIVPEPKKDDGQEKFSRHDLKSASERLRIPTPAERLLQDG